MSDIQSTSLTTGETANAQHELQQLSSIIATWKALDVEVKGFNEQIREKKKRMKVMEEMILRIMTKFNIGALDLKESGGRILLRRSTVKSTLNEKTLGAMLSIHLKSDVAAADALKFINANRTAKTRESLLYEKQ